MTLDEVNAEITKLNTDIANIDTEEKEAKGKGKVLSGRKAKTRQKAQDRLKTLDLMKKSMEREAAKAEKPAVSAPKAATAPVTTVTKTQTKPVSATNTDTEKRLVNTEKKAQEIADEMNSKETSEKKIEDAKSAAEDAKNRASQIDANIEENVPTWFWREAQEIAPTDKAKRGFIITNHILNRLGTALGNTGAIIQNAGGSGGASIKQYGGSFIDQYRQSKIEQAMANRKTRQNSLLQQQIDALVAIGVPENEARAIQNRLRNSAHLNKYNRLTNEQQVYIQGLLYNDAKGKISDAVLGNFIDQIMEGKDVSLEQLAANTLTAAGIEHADKIQAGATGIKDKVVEWLNWKKPGM